MVCVTIPDHEKTFCAYCGLPIEADERAYLAEDGEVYCSGSHVNSASLKLLAPA